LSAKDVDKVRCLFDADYLRERKASRGSDLFNRFLNDPDYFDIGPNPLVDMKHVKKWMPSSNPTVHPFAFYVASGLLDCHGPSKFFSDTAYSEFLRNRNEITADGLFVHYWTVWRVKGLPPHILFQGTDADLWMKSTDVRARIGYDDNIYFDTSFYLRNLRLELPEGVDPVSHYLTTPKDARVSPNPRVNMSWLVEAYGDQIPSEIDPLTWFVTEGARKGALPSVISSSLRARPSASDDSSVRSVLRAISVGRLSSLN
jgi:hypothetical protein